MSLLGVVEDVVHLKAPVGLGALGHGPVLGAG